MSIHKDYICDYNFGGLNVLMPRDLNLSGDLCTSKHGKMDKMNCS